MASAATLGLLGSGAQTAEDLVSLHSGTDADKPQGVRVADFTELLRHVRNQPQSCLARCLLPSVKNYRGQEQHLNGGGAMDAAGGTGEASATLVTRRDFSL